MNAKKKINFILNSVSDAHAIKRINDFKQKGYKVKVYGFDRMDSELPFDDLTVLGRFTNKTTYLFRLKIYLAGLWKLFRHYKRDDSIWYYFGFDVAMFATLMNDNKCYIYEECDIVYVAKIKSKILRSFFGWYDRHIVSCSLKTVFTSEGFMEFHYGSKDSAPGNIVLVPNKLADSVLSLNVESSHIIDPSHIRFAFIGALRYTTLTNIAKVIAGNFSNHEFHFYGIVPPTMKETDLPHAGNIFYHGAFRNPIDLPDIYANVDILIAAYDTSSINVRYAEPNKLYEAIYFRTPIVVSKNTFLANKVRSLGIGTAIDAYDESDICAMVKWAENDSFKAIEVLDKIPKNIAVNGEYIDKIMINIL